MLKAVMCEDYKDKNVKSAAANIRIRRDGEFHPALKPFAIVLYAYCGVSMGKIARLYKISTVAVLKWVRAATLDVAPLNSTCASDIVMIDEVWHFVNGKKTGYGFGEPLTAYL
jgi:hypothetical protein